jgi:hypothetical protein
LCGVGLVSLYTFHSRFQDVATPYGNIVDVHPVVPHAKGAQ